MSKVLFFASTIFSVGTASVASLGLSDLTSQPNCPAIRCIIPTCSGNQLETPKDANGCPLCPKCVGVQTVPNVLTASVASRSTASVASRAAINLDEIDDVVSPWPCPIPMCIPPPCPEWQQEMSYNAQGCPMCRVCKPGAFTNVNAALRASANLDLDLTSVRPCPVPSCIPPSCPQWQQEIAKDDRGCPLCPVCKNTVFTAERGVVANLQLAPTPATAASFANLNFDLAARVCPLLFCTPLNCPAALQVKTTGANGCAGCPRCLDLDIRLPQERVPIPFPDPGPLLNVPVPKLNIPNTFGR